MPLLKEKEFQRLPLPENIRKGEEVFHCLMTNEIFRQYEEFCQRVILCNSMVWTCSLTGKNQLTFSQAVESEQNAQNALKDFPMELQIPLLYLASKTQRTSIAEMAEDVFMYVKDRFFIGETVEASFTSNNWRESRVLQVIAPTEEQIKIASKKGQSVDLQCHPLSSLYQYVVEQLHAEDEDVSELPIVACDHIKGRKNNFTREKIEMFLKQFVEQNDHGVFVMNSVLEKYGIHEVKFDQIFDGPQPNFKASKKSIKNNVKGKKLRQGIMRIYLSKNNGVNPSENTNNVLHKMKMRRVEFHQLKQALKQKKADGKMAEISTIIKDRYKPKVEDLELEDQKKLPVPAPLHSKVPDKYMGDVLMVLEFVHTFAKLLNATDFFPGGLTLELMERALVQKEVAGPLIDVIQMFLTALFSLQSEEASKYSIEVDNADMKRKYVNDNVNLTEATHFATIASSWSVSHQGLPLSKLPLNAFTTSEILRLHLLSSGARMNKTGAKWRYQHRGGYTSEDDPALYLLLKQPHIVKALALHSVTELPIGNKLKIIHCLIYQLLTYEAIRDSIEDRLEKSKQAKLNLRSLQIAERRREQEYITVTIKINKECRENNIDPTPELDRLAEESKRKKSHGVRKMNGLMKTAAKNQTLLGQDRAFRKYLKLESIPGIFVNFEEDNPGLCLNECVKQNRSLVGIGRSETLVHDRKMYEEMNTSYKENEEDKNNSREKDVKKINDVRNSHLADNETDSDSLLICCADSSKCIVHSTKNNKPKWSFYHNREQIEDLTDSLNQRGVRESELRRAISNEQDYLASFVAQTPASRLNPNIEIMETSQKLRPKRHRGRSKYENTNLGYPAEMDSASVLQLALVDSILEMEEEIFAGCLGSIKVKDRNAWREQLHNRQFDNFDGTLVSKTEISRPVDKVKKEGRNSRLSTPDVSKEYRDPGEFLGPTFELDSEDSRTTSDELSLFHTDDHKLSIQTLALALVQVGQGVENQYVKKPLGHVGMKNKTKKTEEQDVMDRWEQSLLAATSYSKIFLHFSTLHNCILWSRSMLSRCQICRQETDSENMLLCDNCNKGHHLYCLKPKLTGVPKGDWYCKECQKQRDKEANLKDPESEQPPEEKRTIFEEEISDEETSEDSEEAVQEEEEEDKEKEEKTSTPEDEEEAEAMDTEREDQEEEAENCDKIEVCTKRGVGGTLLSYEECSEMYRSEDPEPEQPPEEKQTIFEEEISDEETSEQSKEAVQEEEEEDKEKEEKTSTPEDEEEAEGMDTEREDREEEAENCDKIEVCTKRGVGGTLLSYDECSKMYRLEDPEPEQPLEEKRTIFEEEISDEETSEQSKEAVQEEEEEDKEKEEEKTSTPEDEEEAEGMDTEREDREEEAENCDKIEVCTKRGVGGTLLSYDECSEMYRSEDPEPEQPLEEKRTIFEEEISDEETSEQSKEAVQEEEEEDKEKEEEKTSTPEDEEEAEGMDTEREDREEEAENCDKIEVCTKRGVGGTLLSYDECSEMYRSEDPEPEQPLEEKRTIFEEEISDEETSEQSKEAVQEEEEEDKEKEEEKTSTPEDEEEAEGMDTEREDREEEAENCDKIEVCTKRGVGGTLLSYDECSKMYRLEDPEPEQPLEEKRTIFEEEISDEETSEQSKEAVQEEEEEDEEKEEEKTSTPEDEEEAEGMDTEREDREEEAENCDKIEVCTKRGVGGTLLSYDECSEMYRSEDPEPEQPLEEKRTIFEEEISDEESSEDSEEAVQEEEEEDKEKEEEKTSTPEDEEEAEAMDTEREDQEEEAENCDKIEVCTKRGVGGTLLSYDKCSEMYRSECAKPRLRRVSRRKRLCCMCSIQKSGESSDSNSNGEVVGMRRSNLRKADSHDDLPLHNAHLQELLSDVLKQGSAWPFRRRVRKMEVPDYYNIITKPMDFGTIKYKLNVGEYKCDDDFMLDAALVFQNCNTYSNAEEEVYKCGATLRKYFINRCEELGLSFSEKLIEHDDDNIDPPALKKMRTK